jgi:molybdenum cofactor sulfurtransferase
MKARLASFTRKYPEYGYDGTIDELRKREFPRLTDTYLDHAGATLYAKSQVSTVVDELQGEVFGNPHSQGRISQATTHKVQAVRHQVLEFFNTDSQSYSVVFTAGTTAALKIVGESFRWSSASTFCYSRNCHNSVLGIRQYALKANAKFEVVDPHEMGLQQEGERKENSTAEEKVAGGQGEEGEEGGGGEGAFHLFAFPGECNFSGCKHDLPSVLRRARNGEFASPRARNRGGKGRSKDRWMTMLDAAKLATCTPLDLSTAQPDFVSVSFYKVSVQPITNATINSTNLFAALRIPDRPWCAARAQWCRGGPR